MEYGRSIGPGVVDHRASRTGRWLRARRTRFALWIAVVEGLFVALHVISWWAAIAAALIVVLFWFSFGHRLRADAARQVSWIAAVSQAVVALVPVLVIVCPLLIPALFRARWTPAVPLVQWLSLECVLLTLTGIIASAQNATGRAGERLGVTLGFGLARWGLGYLAVVRFGLSGIGPLVVSLSLGELLLTASLVRWRNRGCGRLMGEVFRPLLTGGGMLVVSMGVGRVAGHDSPLLRTAVSLAAFLMLVAIREIATQGRLLTRELRALFAMFRLSYSD